MEPIFKIEEKVRVKRRVGDSHDYKYSFTDNMARLAGKTFTIIGVRPNISIIKCKYPDDNALYILKEDKDGYSWASSMLEKISEISSDSLIKPRKKLVLNFKV